MSRASYLALAVLLLLPGVVASGPVPPEGATRVAVGSHHASHWIESRPDLTDGSFDPIGTAGPNTTAAVVVATLMDQLEANGSIVWTANVSSSALNFSTSSVTLRKNYTGNVTTSEQYHFATFNFTTPEAASTYSYTVDLTLFAERNGTLVELGNATSSGSLEVTSVEVPAPPVDRTPILIGAGALLLVGAVIGVVVGRQRAIRRRMNEAPRRSQVMRDLELEKKLEKAKEKDPEQAVVIQHEIRQAEQVREKRREVQILEAKRADALKTLDLLKKRHEAGGLTKLQYDNMAAKKRADLERIEAEIAQMEREDGGAAA